MRLVILILLAALSVYGCTGTNYRTFTIDKAPATSLSIDARQRVILVSNHGGPDGGRRVVCAEPSPDVFTTAAVSAALNAKLGKEEVGGALSRAEMAGALGVRTQTIQLLRDGLYRACEAYMNGIIDVDEYKKMISAYDEVLITLVAVEGLTQQIRTPLPVMGGHTSATSASSGSTASSDARPAIVTTSSTPLPEAAVAKQVHEIVRDYYCFQVGLKEFFYPKLGTINETVRKQLCSQTSTQ